MNTRITAAFLGPVQDLEQKISLSEGWISVSQLSSAGMLLLLRLGRC